MNFDLSEGRWRNEVWFEGQALKLGGIRDYSSLVTRMRGNKESEERNIKQRMRISLLLEVKRMDGSEYPGCKWKLEDRSPREDSQKELDSLINIKVLLSFKWKMEGLSLKIQMVKWNRELCDINTSLAFKATWKILKPFPRLLHRFKTTTLKAMERKAYKRD